MFAWRRSALRRRVLVNLKTDKAFEGILYAQRGPLLVLRDVTLRATGQATPIDGEVIVERPNVDFVQVLTGG